MLFHSEIYVYNILCRSFCLESELELTRIGVGEMYRVIPVVGALEGSMSHLHSLTLSLLEPELTSLRLFRNETCSQIAAFEEN